MRLFAPYLNEEFNGTPQRWEMMKNRLEKTRAVPKWEVGKL
jgi:hypothetical protein